MKKRKKLEKLKIESREILPASDLLNIHGGSGGQWTTSCSNTYVGANGDHYDSCDIGNPDGTVSPCDPPQSTQEWGWC